MQPKLTLSEYLSTNLKTVVPIRSLYRLQYKK